MPYVNPLLFYIVVKHCKPATLPFFLGINHGVNFGMKLITQFYKRTSISLYIGNFPFLLVKDYQQIPIGVLTGIIACP